MAPLTERQILEMLIEYMEERKDNADRESIRKGFDEIYKARKRKLEELLKADREEA